MNGAWIPDASKARLSSQRFWDHIDKIQGDTGLSIWKSILKGVVEREGIDLSSVSYDGTNFYSFIDTFNLRCEVDGVITKGKAPTSLPKPRRRQELDKKGCFSEVSKL